MWIINGHFRASHKQWVERIDNTHIVVSGMAVIFVDDGRITIHTNSFRTYISKVSVFITYSSKTRLLDECELCKYTTMFSNRVVYRKEHLAQLPTLLYNRHFRVNMYVKLGSWSIISDIVDYGGLEL